jgi:oxygen-independent coproporphyrinogen-3 oxidase
VEFGVYVHIPFCTHRCDYCDFATWTDRAHLVDAYVEACVADLGRHAPSTPPATSVFFGGGTPSLLDAAQLGRILSAIARAEEAEVTVECNPDTVDVARLAGYRAAGVNRVSFGVQSLRPHVLAALGRTHDPDNVTRAITAARAAGFDNVNVDLIYGAAGETMHDWSATVEGTVALGVEHVSAYALTIEPATPLGRRVASGITAAPDDDEQAAKYECADSLLGAAGFEWYEISNWARPGHECRHNRCYWSQGEYLAIGCAAHGHTRGRRWWNVGSPERYIERISGGFAAVAGAESLEPRARAQEEFVLALRTSQGAHPLPGTDRCCDELAAAGLVWERHGRIVLTRAGRLLANEVTARMLVAAEEHAEEAALGRAGTR